MPAPAVTDTQRRRAAVVLIAIGLDQQPGDPWGVATLAAESLGLVPTPPPTRPGRGYRDTHGLTRTGPATTGKGQARTPEGTFA